MEERRIKVVVEIITDSKKQISDIRGSVGPATSESLKKAENFLADLEKEIASDVPNESWAKTFRLAITLGMLLAFGRLLQELAPGAVTVIGQILGK